MKYLYTHVRRNIIAKWHDIGLELLDEEDETSLEAIHVNYNNDVEKCAGEMLKLWLARQRNASWNQLIQVLRQPNIQLIFLAIRIENSLLKEEGILVEGIIVIM